RPVRTLVVPEEISAKGALELSRSEVEPGGQPEHDAGRVVVVPRPRSLGVRDPSHLLLADELEVVGQGGRGHVPRAVLQRRPRLVARRIRIRLPVSRVRCVRSTGNARGGCCPWSSRKRRPRPPWRLRSACGLRSCEQGAQAAAAGGRAGSGAWGG